MDTMGLAAMHHRAAASKGDGLGWMGASQRRGGDIPLRDETHRELGGGDCLTTHKSSYRPRY